MSSITGVVGNADEGFGIVYGDLVWSIIEWDLGLFVVENDDPSFAFVESLQYF